MRARSLKPSLFKNELLAVADPLYTMTFIGLWCAADREGRLEDRPGRLHIEINPGRAFEGTERALSWLADNGFIVRYSVEGAKYIAIPAFLRHQRPHQNEKPSTIPGPELATKVTSAPVNSSCDGEPRKQAEHNLGTKHFALTPDSGLLTPDSGLLTAPTTVGGAGGGKKPKAAPDAQFAEQFERFRKAYPKRAGSHRWPKAESHVRARLKEGHTWGEIHAGVARYAEFVAATGKAGTEVVQQAATFVGTGKGFLDDWTPPAPRPAPARRLTKFEQLTAGLGLDAGEEAAA